MTIAVLGATGGQGGAVVAALLEAGQQVRAVVRDPASARARALAASGVEVVPGEMTDADSLTAAFSGAAAAYGLTTPFQEGLDAEVAQGTAIIEAAARASLPHLVMASVASADRHTGIPHFETKARVEQALSRAGLPATVVAPTYFYDNALGALEEVAVGEIAMALPAQTPLQQISRLDLGRVVAAVVADPGLWIGRRVEVAGDDPTPARMARIVGDAAGGPVTFRRIPMERLRQANPDMAAMFTYLTESGYHVDLAALRADFPGIQWMSFADWAQEQSWPVPGR
ncbi:NmrA family NAD(P)-binding protein [Streptomyces sp. NPDC048409]|uniref:NmrA family NAD(P)-binding protein n=1 Tax=Streptomyces sp. NPDC048409 TaxID=3154723 RepID=UPI00341B0D47